MVKILSIDSDSFSSYNYVKKSNLSKTGVICKTIVRGVPSLINGFSRFLFENRWKLKTVI